MNHLRVHKFELSYAASENNNAVASNNNSDGSGKGLLTRIKRYSTSQRHLTGSYQKHAKGGSPPKISSGTYSMTGADSEDHRLEIGAPVLISTTTLDPDRFGVTEARLRQIGGGIAINSNVLPTTMAATMTENSTQPSPQMPSSCCKNKAFADTFSSQQIAATNDPRENRAVNNALLENSLELNNPEVNYNNKVVGSNNNSGEQGKLRGETPAHAPSAVALNDFIADVVLVSTGNQKILAQLNEVLRAPKRQPRLSKQYQQSKSAQDLHRSEFQDFLLKSSSMDLAMNATSPELNVPQLSELYRHNLCKLKVKQGDKENLMPHPPTLTSVNTVIDPTKYSLNEDSKINSFLERQHHFKSIDSCNLVSKQNDTLCTSDASIENCHHQHVHHHRNRHQHRIHQPFGSKNSLASCNSKTSQISHNISAIADFNMKSISYQSLNASNLFVSIDELNEITRQINESEFNRDIDLDYCRHRDNLKPSERRITLLKNKNSRLINFNQNKEKLKKGWHDVKKWLGEETTRLRDVVQKQKPLKYLGTTKLNLSQPEVQSSLSSRQKSEPRETETSSVLNQDASSDSADDSNSRELKTSFENDTVSAADEYDFSAKYVSDEDLSKNTRRHKDKGQNGFEELRRYVKQGGDFSKELIIVLQERVDSEIIYSKSLSKMASKLNKACRVLPGSIVDAWSGIATEMESRSDLHRQLATSLTDEIVKPLKTVVDCHHKSRKSVESNVDKAARTLSEWRGSEVKAKKASHLAARENEKLQDAMLDIRIQKSPSISLLHQGSNKGAADKEIKSAEKDCVKLDNKRKKAEEAVKRADVEYYTLCVRAERARVDWEMAVLRGSSQLQSSESQRLINMKSFVLQYVRLTANINPILNGLVQGLQQQIDACNVSKDMQVVKNIRRNSEGSSEQLLPDFYCEHTTLAMNRERRKHSLIKLLQLVKIDLERERRSRDGLRGLSQSLSTKEHQNVTDKLYHIRSMLTYLEGARLKLHSALLELDHRPRTTHPLAQHIQITRDRTGLQQSILKVPNWLKNNDNLSTTNVSVDVMNYHDCHKTSMLTTTTPSKNTSCINISDAINGEDRSMITMQITRSKSNIENLGRNPKTLSANAISAPAVMITAPNKSKTIPANIHEQYSDRGQADGGSNQQGSDFDEFSSQDDSVDDDESHVTDNLYTFARTRRPRCKKQQERRLLDQKPYYQDTQNDHNNASLNLLSAKQCLTTRNIGNSSCAGDATVTMLGRCKALYSYTPKLYDELKLNPGDIIEVHAKQDDGWWLGALHNKVGIFPATYVEEFA